MEAPLRFAFPLALMAASALVAAQTPDTPEAHVAVAKAAAGEDYQNLFNFVCATPAVRGGARGATPGPARGAAPAPARGGQRGAAASPDRSTWYAEPVKAFDSMVFVGQSEYSVWAIVTSEGLIVIDTIFDYSVEEEVEGGLKKLGLDPAKIKYAIVTHPHPDHHGGAKFLQDKYGTRVVMSAADWDFLERTNGTKPKRDMEATDGQKLTLGDTTVTIHFTPGHTPGTLSVLIPIADNGKPHLAALWGGMGLNADRESLETYIKSARKFAAIVKQSGADIILSNHTDWDRSKVNLPILAKREPGGANPYIVGNEQALRFMKLPEECATARVMRLN
jgi:metallo-beta-lactamase class B